MLSPVESGRGEKSETCHGCGHKCMKKGNKSITYYEYVGPVKIVIVEPSPNEYLCKVLQSVLTNLASILMGATVMHALYFTLKFDHHWTIDTHILLCTLGYQICMPSALLLRNPLAGPAIWMTNKQRKLVSLALKMLTFVCVMSGALILILYHETFKKKDDKIFTKLTVHSYSGILTLTFSVMDALTFFCYNVDYNSFIGKLLDVAGILTFSASSITFITGLLEPNYIKWLKREHVVYALCAFCAYYTLVIVCLSIAKWISNSNSKKEDVKDKSVGSSSNSSRVDLKTTEVL